MARTKGRGKKSIGKKTISQPDANAGVIPPAPVSLCETTQADTMLGKRKADSKSLSGFIFMCNGRTKPECYRYRVFGLPAGRREDVEKVKTGTKLFLFDFDVKLLYGVYEATSDGQMNLEPSAFGGKFPAQVSFAIHKECLPLREIAFKYAIRDNYKGSKFKAELTHQQVKDLLSLFPALAAAAVAPIPQVASLQAFWHPGLAEFQPLVMQPPSQDPYLAGAQPAYAAPTVGPQSVQRVLNDPYFYAQGQRPYLAEDTGQIAQDPYSRRSKKGKTAVSEVEDTERREREAADDAAMREEREKRAEQEMAGGSVFEPTVVDVAQGVSPRSQSAKRTLRSVSGVGTSSGEERKGPLSVFYSIPLTPICVELTDDNSEEARAEGREYKVAPWTLDFVHNDGSLVMNNESLTANPSLGESLLGGVRLPQDMEGGRDVCKDWSELCFCLARAAQLGFNFKEVFHFGAKDGEKVIEEEMEKLRAEVARLEPSSALAEKYQREVAALKETSEFQSNAREEEVKKLKSEVEEEKDRLKVAERNLKHEKKEKEILRLQVEALKPMREKVDRCLTDLENATRDKVEKLGELSALHKVQMQEAKENFEKKMAEVRERFDRELAKVKNNMEEKLTEASDRGYNEAGDFYKQVAELVDIAELRQHKISFSFGYQRGLDVFNLDLKDARRILPEVPDLPESDEED